MVLDDIGHHHARTNAKTAIDCGVIIRVGNHCKLIYLIISAQRCRRDFPEQKYTFHK